MVHDFVATQFNKLRDFLLPSIVSNERIFAGMFSSYTPVAATVSSHQLYHQHFVENVSKYFITNYVSKPGINRTIKKFSDWVREFINYSKMMQHYFPITKTGFIMSRFCPSSISGLIISLDSLDAGNDTLKYNRFISNDAFDKYFNIVSAHGFYVDKNVPWRIAANLDHPEMSAAMSAAGTSLDDNHMFTEYFHDSEWFSYYTMKAYLYQTYRQITADPELQTWGTNYSVKNCIKATWIDAASNVFETISTRGEREKISDDYKDAEEDDSTEGQFQRDYPDSFFLPVYLKLRMTESHLEWSDRNFHGKLKTVLRIHKLRGIKKAVELIGILTRQSRIYIQSSQSPQSLYRIKYFGNAISSGLHSYLKDDRVQVDKEKRQIILDGEASLSGEISGEGHPGE